MTCRARQFALALLFTAQLGPWPVAAQVSEDDRPKLAALPRLFEALGVAPGAQIADVGSGDGFYSMQLALAVGPSGRVTASDISSDQLDRLRSHLANTKIENLDIVLGRLDDPLLGKGVFDGVLIRNAYHEMTESASILRHIHLALKAGGRLVVAEPIQDKNRLRSREEQVAVHQIAPEFVRADLEAAGFVVLRCDEDFEPLNDSSSPGGYWLIVAVPANSKR